jgi:hypothetical protein
VWTEAVLVAVVAALGAVVVELVRTRRKAASAAENSAAVVHEVTPNSGSSLKDAVVRIEKTVDEVRVAVHEIRDDQAEHGERIAALEAVTGTRARARWRR